jgi:hypothetical protein
MLWSPPKKSQSNKISDVSWLLILKLTTVEKFTDDWSYSKGSRKLDLIKLQAGYSILVEFTTNEILCL